MEIIITIKVTSELEEAGFLEELENLLDDNSVVDYKWEERE